MAGDGEFGAVVDGVAAVEVGGEVDGEVAGFGVDVAGLGLFADAVFVEGCAVGGCWLQMVPSP
ncbi:hypothetical protein [Arthrobacter psychrolactophilus]